MQHLFLFFFFACCCTTSVRSAVDDSPHKNGELILMLEPGVQPEAILVQNKYCEGIETKLEISDCLAKSSGVWLVRFDSLHINEVALIKNIKYTRGVVFVQYNHYISQRGIPSDTQFASQYALNNTGQGGGTVDADIDATEAWDITTGGLTVLGDTIVVAVIDAGFQLTHPDLNFWKNYNEIAGNGIDDDGNGFIDDVNGWNVFTHNGNIVNNQHGTHVAGIIGAKGNNSLGVSGVNWNVKLLPVVGATTLESQAIEAYGYVMESRRLYNNTNGAKGAFIVSTNSSFGVDQGQAANFPVWCAFYDSLGAVGILSAGATANNNWNIDNVGDIPCSCPSVFLIGVSSTDKNDAKVVNSGYGVQSIDIAAPGASVYSTYPTSSYNTLSGTSMASPHVAGSIALMYAAACDSFMMDYELFPDSIASRVKNILMNAVNPKIGFDTLYNSGGRLNVFQAVQDIQTYGNCSAIGLTMYQAGFDMEIYPNPAMSELTILFGEIKEKALLEIKDICGRSVKKIAIGISNKLQIDISDLEEGVYYFTIITGSQKLNGQKFVKMK